MGEIKQANFRVDEERAAAFRAYCEANGINQAVGFERMLEALELQQAKEAIPARETEIGEFERCLRHLQAAYLNSLELNEQAEARIREEFARQLDAKDRTIANNQDQIDALKAEKAALSDVEARAKDLQVALDAANEQYRQSRMDYEDRLADKSRALKDADARMAMLEIKAGGYDELKEAHDKLAASLAAAESDAKVKEREHQFALDMAKKDAEQDKSTAIATAVAAARAEKDAQIEGLRQQLQDARVQAKDDLRAAEKQAHDAEKAATERFNTEIRKMEHENADLKAEIARLKALLPKE